jgi:hypothetical protein
VVQPAAALAGRDGMAIQVLDHHEILRSISHLLPLFYAWHSRKQAFQIDHSRSIDQLALET